MNNLDYAYSVAYIRAIENKLLTGADIENLITAKTPEDAVQLLMDKGYCREKIAPGNFEAILAEQLRECWDEVISVAPKGASLDILLYKNDFHNLKAVIKGVMTGIKDLKPYIAVPNTVDYSAMVSAAANAEFSSLPDMLKETAEQAYDVLSRTGDSQLSDTIIDKASMDYTMSRAIESKNSFLIGYVSLLNTISDIKIAVRSSRTAKDAEYMESALSEKSNIQRSGLIKAALAGFDSVVEFLFQSGFSEYASALKESMTDFENACEKSIAAYMKKSGYIAFGIEPLISYIYAKQSEIRTIRIIMSAKLHNLSEELIRKRI